MKKHITPFPQLIKPLPEPTPLLLATMRKRIYLNQAQAAELCRTKVQNWRNWESGKYQIPEPIFAFWLIQYHRVRKIQLS